MPTSSSTAGKAGATRIGPLRDGLGGSSRWTAVAPDEGMERRGGKRLLKDESEVAGGLSLGCSIVFHEPLTGGIQNLLPPSPGHLNLPGQAVQPSRIFRQNDIVDLPPEFPWRGLDESQCLGRTTSRIDPDAPPAILPQELSIGFKTWRQPGQCCPPPHDPTCITPGQFSSS